MPPEVRARTVLINSLSGELHDIRGLGAELPGVYDPVDYAAGQALGRRLHGEGSFGIAYDSVRHPGGQCVAGFRPRLFSNARQERHLCYVWDGTSIREVYDEAEAELSSVVAAGEAVIGGQIGAIARKLAKSGRPAILAVNPDLSRRPLRIESAGAIPNGQKV